MVRKTGESSSLSFSHPHLCQHRETWLQSVETALGTRTIALDTSRGNVWGRCGTSVHQRTLRKLQERGPFSSLPLPSHSLSLSLSLSLSHYHSTTSVCPPRLSYLSLSLCSTLSPVAVELFPCRCPVISAAARSAVEGKAERQVSLDVFPVLAEAYGERSQPVARGKESKRARREAAEPTFKWREAGEAEVKRDRPSLLQGPRLVQSGTARLLLHAPRGRTANVDTNT